MFERIKRYLEIEKIVRGDYGDSLKFLSTQWAHLAWLKGIDPSVGIELIDTISEDVKILLKELLRIKKKEDDKNAVKKRDTK